MFRKYLLSVTVLALLLAPALQLLAADTDYLADSADKKPAGLLAKVIKLDTNKDGTADRFEYYKDGVLDKIEADSNHDGKVDEWGVVEAGKIVRAEKDTDGDGKVDKWVDY